MEDTDVARHGLLALFDRLGGNDQLHGHLWEMQVAGHLARRPSTGSVAVAQPLLGGSDIDILVDGVVYQAKVNAEAFRHRSSGIGLERSINRYLGFARDTGYTEVVYICPPRQPAHRVGVTPDTATRFEDLAAGSSKRVDLLTGMTLDWEWDIPFK
ncbi:hypothetical protein [Rubricoccus marinus]|nr:hypothetical protein [Rubricoccus marinus]